jgi:hypothetical protein
VLDQVVDRAVLGLGAAGETLVKVLGDAQWQLPLGRLWLRPRL